MIQKNDNLYGYFNSVTNKFTIYLCNVDELTGRYMLSGFLYSDIMRLLIIVYYFFEDLFYLIDGHPAVFKKNLSNKFAGSETD